MPYTPPAPQSPAASGTESPPPLKEYQPKPRLPPSSPFSNFGPRPGLPRSASSTAYLTKHRRSPSTPVSSLNNTTNNSSLLSVPETQKDDRQDQSNNAAYTNRGFIVMTNEPSPPDSQRNSSDEDLNSYRGRSRNSSDMTQLHAAVRGIEQHQLGRHDKELTKTKTPLKIALPESEPQMPADEDATPTAITVRENDISHAKPETEENDNIRTPLSRTPSDMTVDSQYDESEEDDETPRKGKPPMLRKKSGELVRPALRPPSARRRPSSMPGTPTFSKAVHFDKQLEQVRHFLQVDKPLAVSAGSSPNEEFGAGGPEYPFSNDPRDAQTVLEMTTTNFPPQSQDRSWQTVRVERVYLSPDKKTLIGNVAVANLAFQKYVTTRFTLDYWKTTSEVSAEYSQDPRNPQMGDGYDRFNFYIKISEHKDIVSKTLFFCVRYNVNGQEFWDSNNNMNFQVDFIKKILPPKEPQAPEKEKAPTAELGSLPHSKSSPKKYNATFEFGHDDGEFDDLDTVTPRASILNEAPLKFRSRSAIQLNARPKEKSKAGAAPAQAFGNRYDFGASLSAAIQAASTILGEKSGLSVPAPKDKSHRSQEHGQHTRPAVSGSTQSALNNPKPAALTSAGAKPALQSDSYNELLDKYCFFGTAKPPAATTLPAAQAQEDSNSGSSSDSSGSEPSSPVNTPASENGRGRKPRFHGHDISSPMPHSNDQGSAGAGFGYPFHAPSHAPFFASEAKETAIRG